MSDGRTAVEIRASRYAVLAEYARLTGVSVEDAAEEALTDYLAKDSKAVLKAE